jgi:peptide/nickel transport system substrate-binding protein
MRAPRLRSALAVAAVASLVFAAAGCAESDREPEGTKKDTLVFGVSDPKVLDPILASDGESLRVARQVLETLVKPEAGGAKVVAGLATEFTPDSTGLVWTFKLKSGVKFHDGTDFDAAAVCFNFDRWYNFTGLMQSSDVSAYWQDVFGGFAKNESPELGDSLYKSCKAKDAGTAEITISKVTSKFPAALSLPSFSISSPAALKKYEADKITGTADNVTYPEYASHPVGTGPYVFTEWDRTNKVVKLTANENYHDTKASIKNLQFKTVEAAGRRQALESGEIQGYDLVGTPDQKPLKDAGYNLLVRPAFNILYLAINQAGNPALAKPEVRQAIALAINKQAIVDSKYPTGAKVATSFYPDSVPGYNAGVEANAYNVAKAKELLASAGYASGLTLKFHYPTEVTRPYMPAPKDIFELMAADLKAIGITVEPIALKWSPDYLNATTEGAGHDLHLLGWTGDYGDAYNFIGTFFSRQKDEFGFNNPELFAKFAAADAEPDLAKRAKLYEGLSLDLSKFIPAVPIAHGPNAIVFAKDVTGIVPSPLTDEKFSTASFK